MLYTRTRRSQGKKHQHLGFGNTLTAPLVLVFQVFFNAQHGEHAQLPD